MWPVQAPTAAAPQLYDELVAGRRQATRVHLQAARSHICQAYNAYAAAPAQVTALTPIAVSPILGAALKGNYPRFRKTHDELYASIKLAARWCPYCGERPVTSLDHYLPNSVFPEYSVLPVNLVPACSDCNKTKDVNYVDATGQPLFLHAYFDNLHGFQCVHASVDTSTGTALLTFDIRCPSAVDAAVAAKVERHFTNLKLGELYRDKAEQEASVRANEVQSLLAANVSAAGIGEHLSRGAHAATQVHGPNHWRPVALRTLAASPDFCAGSCAPQIRY